MSHRVYSRGPFDRSGTPPSRDGVYRRDARGGFERAPPFDLVRGVLRASERDRGAAANLGRRDEPAAPVSDEDEQPIAPRRGESLDHTVPALVAALGADHHLEAAIEQPPARLHLDAEKSAVDAGDEIAVWRAAHGNPDGIAARGKPLDCRGLAQIALRLGVHAHEHTFPAGRNWFARRGGLEGPPPRAEAQPESRRRWASGSDSSFFRVWFSIWRMRSRVTLNARPTSSSV